MFAGPNGSGKSTLYEKLRKENIIHTEMYVSADRIEAELRKKKKFVFNAYRVKVTEDGFNLFCNNYFILMNDRSTYERVQAIHIKSGVLTISNYEYIDSYIASCIAAYLAQKLLGTRQSFCFETVMSHESKLSLLQRAKDLDYKTYLYFVYTDNPQLNIERIKARVRDGGHSVEKKKVIARYSRSLAKLSDAVSIAHKSYLYDNSAQGEQTLEINHGNTIVSKKKGYDFKKKLPAFYSKYRRILERR